jgi:hypothetical protein
MDIQSILEQVGTAPKAPTPPEDVSEEINWTLPGFGPMTRISTSFGDVHAQVLRERDMVRTASGNLKPVLWVDRVKLDQGFMRKAPNATAILIRAGALGNGLPKADVIVSPEQEISFGRQGLTSDFHKAKSLLGRPGVVRKPEEIMTYTRFHCGEPVSVKVEGIWARVSR